MPISPDIVGKIAVTGGREIKVENTAGAGTISLAIHRRRMSDLRGRTDQHGERETSCQAAGRSGAAGAACAAPIPSEEISWSSRKSLSASSDRRSRFHCASPFIVWTGMPEYRPSSGLLISALLVGSNRAPKPCCCGTSRVPLPNTKPETEWTQNSCRRRRDRSTPGAP